MKSGHLKFIVFQLKSYRGRSQSLEGGAALRGLALNRLSYLLLRDLLYNTRNKHKTHV